VDTREALYGIDWEILFSTDFLYFNMIYHVFCLCFQEKGCKVNEVID
jgi:hypothetical protein